MSASTPPHNDIRRRRNSNLKAMLLFLLLFNACAVTNQRYVTDNCDWLDSVPLTSSHGVRLIRPVQLRCAEGRVQWRYPQIPLKIVLTLGTSGREFTACVRMWRSGSGRILVQSSNAELRPVLNTIDCFRSVAGQTVLYIEPTGYSHRSTIDFSYQLFSKKATAMDYYDKHMADCNEETLVRLYCACDYAARGRMLRAQPNRKLGVTEVDVLESRVYRQSWVPLAANSTKSRTKTVHLSLSCDLREEEVGGREELMLIGQMMFGEPRVLCAPRWTRWKATALHHNDKAQCQLPIN